MKAAMKKLEELLEWGGTKKEIALLVISAVALIMSLAGIRSFPFDMAWVAILLCGVPILCEALIGLVTEFDITADVLVASALIASVCIGEIFAAGEVAFIMQLGALLEDLTVARARAGIEKLVKLTPRSARVLRDGTEETIPAEEVRVGDVLLVKPGETVPVDGVVETGETSIDQSVMTGESLPVDKSPGDGVYSGTVNRYGAFTMTCTKVGEDSSIQRMVRLVESADADKAKIVTLADRWAVWFVVASFSIALLTLLITRQPIRAVTVLVVFCPCSLVLATPTAIMAGIGNATRHGFLVREGDALERLAAVSRILFDKTGTLTYGTPEVIDIVGQGDPAALLRMCAGAEGPSEHPLGQAVIRRFRGEGGALPAAGDFRMLPGQGVSATVEGYAVLAGNLKLLASHAVAVPAGAGQNFLDRGCTLIYMAVDGEYRGFLALSDTLRPDSRGVVEGLTAQGVRATLLTGDNGRAAAGIAGELGIGDYRASCLPEDKLNYIGTCQAAGESVCMMGDGINDAPALKRADVGVAMGGVGSDITVDAADIVLVNDDVKELPHLFGLSRHMMGVIRFNIAFSMALNLLAVTLAAIGTLDPVIGALVHNAGSVFVIMHSSLLLNWRGKA